MTERKSVPLWLVGLLISLGSVGLTLASDRVTVAASLASLSARVETLERAAVELKENYKETHLMHLEILKELAEVERRQQQIIDRQDEVRRKLGIAK